MSAHCGGYNGRMSSANRGSVVGLVWPSTMRVGSDAYSNILASYCQYNYIIRERDVV